MAISDLILEEINALEQSWIGRIPADPGYFAWEPFPVKQFADLLAAVPRGRFIDAGCGIGTKCFLAAQAGFDAEGIERVPAFVAEAHRLGVRAVQADVRDWDFSPYDVVYVNHPLACGEGCDDEAVLEHHIHETMRSGAALIAVNYDLAPGCVAHSQLVPCGDSCQPHSLVGYREVARAAQWAAVWVKD